ncbi:hypothetical protein [Enterobacillus tribolii]|uniref:Uncharacterized protein n=1 Tax=Enterobacillus tribolii TaxID=1487935 RepID=A0A370R416_9GAMM|nr:hypothetical protein [Enterobacillus tribolii]MBW7984421.1 hypothetical protein [Enterobacillus tribolii]RDK97159.1 hypothetical protein C8D90_101604 [Enterobacillus tribolii]
MKITVTPHRDEVTLQYDQANQKVTIKCDPCPTMSNELSKSVTLNLTDLPSLIRGLEQVVNSTEINV